MTKKETVMAQVQHIEDVLRVSLHRVSVIENKLNTKLLTIENREKLEKELQDVKQILKSNQQMLQNLRKENTKSFLVSACLIFICFFVYGLYLMFFI